MNAQNSGLGTEGSARNAEHEAGAHPMRASGISGELGPEGSAGGPGNQAAFETIPLAGEVIPRMEGRRSAATKPSPLAPLIFYFLISFSICSACLNVYLFFQARALGAELEKRGGGGRSPSQPKY